MKRFFTVFLIICIVGGAGFFMFRWLVERQAIESTDNAYLKTNQVLITPEVQGTITQLLMEDNQPVKQGDILAVIDDREYQATLAVAEAKVAEELAHIQRLHANKNTQHAHIASAGAEVSVVEAKRQQINQDLRRYNALIERGSAPRQSLDKIAAESKQADAQLRGSQAAVSAQQKQLTSFDSEIAEVEARVKQAEAQVTLAKIDLEHTKIRAPFTGTIGHRGVQMGSHVQAGMALAYLLETGKIWVEANFKETQLQNMKIDQPVEIHIDAYPDIKFTGKVASFSPASGSEFSILPPENATGNFTKIVRRVPVKIVFDANTDTALLKSGLSATVKVRVKN
ncbi:MAG: Secretion protein HlyD family protein [Methylococcaceae bacterium NSP1-2]|nr:HlyD family secretion protein [Methylococcaceae bacterium]OYV16939.1 MAG: Secretion protein HlyD family protein [Methylococcaceae bacterium NSP1-2]